jgi:hypothetical protein
MEECQWSLEIFLEAIIKTRKRNVIYVGNIRSDALKRHRGGKFCK